MSDKMVEVAMGIIINAGDARTCATDAMEAELRGDRAGADAKLKEADEAIKKAHNAQTDVIQDECLGNPTELSMLFMHAQDTVMTIISEVNMIRLMIRMNRNLEDKINGNRN